MIADVNEVDLEVGKRKALDTRQASCLVLRFEKTSGLILTVNGSLDAPNLRSDEGGEGIADQTRRSTPVASAMLDGQRFYRAGVPIAIADGDALVIPCPYPTIEIVPSAGSGRAQVQATDADGAAAILQMLLDAGQPLNHLCFIADASLTCVFELSRKGHVLAKETVTISTSAGSLEHFVEVGSAWSHEYDGAKLLSITGAGTLRFAWTGNGDVDTNNGVTSGLGPTTTEGSIAAPDDSWGWQGAQ